MCEGRLSQGRNEPFPQVPIFEPQSLWGRKTKVWCLEVNNRKEKKLGETTGEIRTRCQSSDIHLSITVTWGVQSPDCFNGQVTGETYGTVRCVAPALGSHKPEGYCVTRTHSQDPPHSDGTYSTRMLVRCIHVVALSNFRGFGAYNLLACVGSRRCSHTRYITIM